MNRLSKFTCRQRLTLLGLAIMFLAGFVAVLDSTHGSLGPRFAGTFAGFVLAVPVVWWADVYLRRRAARTQ